MKFSVLLSVYHKENPSYLRQSLESIENQTRQPDEIIMVKDGPLTDELESVLAEFEKRLSTLKTVSLSRNSGLGIALNEGLKHCSYDLVARMDTDDICKLDRFEKQIAVFEQHPEYDLVSAWIEELVDTTDNIRSVRALPELPEQIYEYGRKRCPVNHPVTMFRKSSVMHAGGYQHFPYLEDYYLWVRMLLAGYKGYNIQEPLLHMRAGSAMYSRRAGWGYVKSQANMFKFMKQQGFIGNGQYVKSCVIRSGSSLAPNWLRKFMFEKVLRK